MKINPMGMFDYVRSDYKIFGDQRDRDLQTKSFNNVLETIYIDPTGQLYRIDYSKCIEYETSDLSPFLIEKKTGKKGRVIPLRDFSGIMKVSALDKDNKYYSTAIEIKNGKILNIYSEESSIENLNLGIR